MPYAHDLLRLVSDVSGSPVPPSDYIKFLTNELEFHRKFLSELVHELMVYFGVGFATLSGVAAFMGWKTLKDIRDSAKETFERETKQIFEQKAAQLNQKYEEISAEHEKSKQRIAELDGEFQEELTTLRGWIATVQTTSLTKGDRRTEKQREAAATPSKILWVDDRLKDQEPLIDEFSRNGIKVDTADDVDGAIKRIAHDDYKLIVIDLGHSIQQTDSLRLLKEMRDMNIKAAKIVFSARWWVANHGMEAEKLGADLVTANPGIVLADVLRRLGRSTS